MSVTNTNKHNQKWFKWIFILFLIDLSLLLAYLVQGKNVALFNPKGLIASEQLKLTLYSAGILFAIAIPTVILLYIIAWKYRESNKKAKYEPSTKNGKLFVLSIWVIPSIFILVLAFVMLPATRKLDPRKTITSNNKQLTIQVIAMRWKWLFIYPEQDIATVNFVQIPVDTPVEFVLTADESPMSSFWIPNLGGQLYAMTSHVNRLNLIAETSGDYPGSSAEITGAGFSGMKFVTRAGTQQDFDEWVQKVKNSPDVLDIANYDNLLLPSENNATAYYSQYEPDIFNRLIAKYNETPEGDSHH